jgi:O-acetyl-ADP-ribose deacetylase (regulator of RNase III)
MKSKINYIKGDATNPQGTGHKIICHICNDIGAWGAGFVLALSAKWSEPEEAYRELTPKERLLGTVMLVPVTPEITVANMIGQRGVGFDKDGLAPIRYGAVRACLAAVNDVAFRTKATLHMPRIGCGLAGGRWEDIEKIIEAVASVDVYVYDLK